MKYMLDTDICSYAIRNAFPVLAARLAQTSKRDACISVISYGELLVGAEKSDTRKRMFDGIERIIQFLHVMPLDEDVASIYAATRANLDIKGAPIGGNDIWIGAHALSLGLTLVTNNVREFKRIPKLKIENWTK